MKIVCTCTFNGKCLNAQSGKEEAAFLPLFLSSIKKSAKTKMSNTSGDPWNLAVNLPAEPLSHFPKTQRWKRHLSDCDMPVCKQYRLPDKLDKHMTGLRLWSLNKDQCFWIATNKYLWLARYGPNKSRNPKCWYTRLSYCFISRVPLSVDCAEQSHNQA